MRGEFLLQLHRVRNEKEVGEYNDDVRGGVESACAVCVLRTIVINEKEVGK